MLRNVKSLIGNAVLSTDGEIGIVDDLCFDSKMWGTAYVVIKVGGTASGGRAFLPPTALGKPDWERREFPVAYSKAQILGSPDLSIDMQALRKKAQLRDEHPAMSFWTLSADLAADGLLNTDANSDVDHLPSLNEDDPNLQSANSVMRYRVQATDGKFGHICDLVVDDSTWEIRYIVVATTQWLPGRRVVISPHSVNRVSRMEEQVYVDLTQMMIKQSLEYETPLPISEEYESRLRDYYASQSDNQGSRAMSVTFH